MDPMHAVIRISSVGRNALKTLTHHLYADSMREVVETLIMYASTPEGFEAIKKYKNSTNPSKG